MGGVRPRPKLALMGSKAAKRRDAAIKALAAALEQFYPEHAGDVLCPTCLRRHPATNVDRWLTEAHILPRSAGGSLSTILCDRCNGPFGTRRDKWFSKGLVAAVISRNKLLTKRSFRFTTQAIVLLLTKIAVMTTNSSGL